MEKVENATKYLLEWLKILYIYMKYLYIDKNIEYLELSYIGSRNAK